VLGFALVCSARVLITGAVPRFFLLTVTVIDTRAQGSFPSVCHRFVFAWRATMRGVINATVAFSSSPCSSAEGPAGMNLRRLRSAQSLDGLQNGLLGLVALLLLQFWLLQGVNSKHYRELAENNRIRTLSIAAPRGMLTDRNGRILAENKPAFKIVVTVGPSGSIDRLSSTLAALLKIDEAEIRHKLSRPRAAYQPVTIKAKASFEDVAAVEARRVELSEVSVEVVPIRSYPQARSGSHVVGRVGEVTDRQLKQPAFADYEPGRVVGQSSRPYNGTSGLMG
jgi:cell division protein FtsI/penicillin-binding protein 2